MIERTMREIDGVVLRGVEQGIRSSGRQRPRSEAEALVRLSDPSGLLVLGQRGGQRFETLHGSSCSSFSAPRFRA